MGTKKTKAKRTKTTPKPKPGRVNNPTNKITPTRNQVNELIQEIKNKKVDVKGKHSVRFELGSEYYYSLIELLKRSTKLGQLEKMIDVLDDEAELLPEQVIPGLVFISSGTLQPVFFWKMESH